MNSEMRLNAFLRRLEKHLEENKKNDNNKVKTENKND